MVWKRHFRDTKEVASPNVCDESCILPVKGSFMKRTIKLF